ncbi:hypothetical protein BUALT_Bualt03G0186800 [Buddleja alternifolia]|uniref:Uncharacterized protein n=1 Tax=Buddleja alternifolia TaxID=168488 RepID=A0AAV6XX36_9LAMI|nr:hypothetical protein BUALT_Bualt03G0186800 [Buddleja alternifolia]
MLTSASFSKTSGARRCFTPISTTRYGDNSLFTVKISALLIAETSGGIGDLIYGAQHPTPTIAASIEHPGNDFSGDLRRGTVPLNGETRRSRIAVRNFPEIQIHKHRIFQPQIQITQNPDLAREKELKKLKAAQKAAATKLQLTYSIIGNLRHNNRVFQSQRRKECRKEAEEENHEDCSDPDTPFGEKKNLSRQMAKTNNPSAVQNSWYE